MKPKKIRSRLSKLPKPKVPERLHRRKKGMAEKYNEALKTLPDITNTTVAEHREEILSSARKYIYPLQHSKRRIVVVSLSLLVVVVVGFFVYCGLALYKFQSNSGFLYGVTQIIPFPVAKSGSSFVAYENYLFELRHYTHYYKTQQQIDFNTTAGKEQLDNFKRLALQNVIDNAYIKQLAKKNHVSISGTEVNNAVTAIRNQDRLGDNEKEFEAILSQFYGWSLNDFKRELSQQLLAQKVAASLDTVTQSKAQTALAALKSGTDFSSVVSQYSDDTSTKSNGGQFSFTINANNQSLPQATVNTLLSLAPGQISGIVNLGSALEIDKVISKNSSGQIQAAHILFNFQPISTYLKPFEKQHKTHRYISLPSS